MHGHHGGLPRMEEWIVLFDEEFAEWLQDVDEGLRIRIAAHVDLLEQRGPSLGRPRVDTVKGSAYPNMKELRIQYEGLPWRVLFTFDPNRAAILLVGGMKAGNKRWYLEHVPIADQRFKRHLESLENEGG
jgi:hypothetical protein